REKLQITRQRAKLEKNLGSIVDMTRLPGALFVVDTKREDIAIAEAKKLNIPIFAMVDTNSDPRPIDFVIPSNDDASKSIEKILGYATDAIAEGLSERKADKDKVVDKEAKETPKAKVIEAPKTEVKETPKAEVKEAPKTKVKETPKAKVPAEKVKESK
ncbi:MAG: 30S ribosomal protein S2, partial [Aureibaculum sp.]